MLWEAYKLYENYKFFHTVYFMLLQFSDHVKKLENMKKIQIKDDGWELV